MDTQNDVALPSEVILHVFSFLPQKELFTTVNKVCKYWKQLCLSRSLWTSFNYHDVYGDITSANDHIQTIQDFVVKLVIDSKILEKLFFANDSLKFVNLKKLDISNKLLCSHDLIGVLSQRCPSLNDLKLFGRKNFSYCIFGLLTKFQLVALDIESYHHREELLDNTLHKLICTKQNLLLKFTFNNLHIIRNDVIANMVDEWKCLKSLSLLNNNFRGNAFTQSKHHLELTELTIHSDWLFDSELKCITDRAKQLRSLNIKHCKHITDDGLVHVSKCQFLEKLYFGNIYSFSHDTSQSYCSLFVIAEGCKRLKYFSSIGWRTINDDVIIQLVKSCKHLSHILISGCSSVTDASLFAIGENCSGLTFICLNNCRNISLAGIIFLISTSKYLQRIILSYCLGIDDGNSKLTPTNNGNCPSTVQIYPSYGFGDTWEIFFLDLPKEYRQEVSNKICKGFHSHLKEMVLRFCPNISETTVINLVKWCPDLSKLSLFDCNIDTDEKFIRQLIKRCGLLKNLCVNSKSVDLTS